METYSEADTSELKLPYIHAVTNSAAVRRSDFLETAVANMRALGPLGALHLRSSEITGRHFYELAEGLVEAQNATGCWLVINDRVDIAAAVGAKGIQLASHSLRVHEARAVTKDTPIGISIHSVDEAVEAEQQGASWVVAGTVFETPTHPGVPGERIVFITEVAKAIRIPIIAIGGVQPEHIPLLIAAGAYGVATIRGASWEREALRHDTDPSPGKTRLAGAPGAPAGEVLARYISAYDWSSGKSGEHYADGERRSTGDSAE
jgi:thiamine-phosphate diphosphorylase